MLATPYCSRDARQLFPVDRVWQASQLPTRTVRDSMTDTKETLEELSREYQDAIPSDLRATHSFDWYPRPLVRRPANRPQRPHQRVADMFDYYGTEYDEDAGVVEYKLASEDP